MLRDKAQRLNECNLLHHSKQPFLARDRGEKWNRRLGLMWHIASKKYIGNETNNVDIDWSISVFESNSFVVYNFNFTSMDLISFGLEIYPQQVGKTNVRCFVRCVLQVLELN